LRESKQVTSQIERPTAVPFVVPDAASLVRYLASVTFLLDRDLPCTVVIAPSTIQELDELKVWVFFNRVAKQLIFIWVSGYGRFNGRGGPGRFNCD
jgi:hypothetical protein